MRIMYVSMHLFEARYAVETLDSLYLEMKQDQLNMGTRHRLKIVTLHLKMSAFHTKKSVF